MGATATARGDQAAAAASSSTARVTAATRLRCRRKNIPPHQSSSRGPGRPLARSRIDAAGRSGFTHSPQNPQKEPSCRSARLGLSVPRLCVTRNGPHDSSCVHVFERRIAWMSTDKDREPDGWPPGSQSPASPPCGGLTMRARGAPQLTGLSLNGAKGDVSVSPEAQPCAIGRMAQSALSFLSVRATRAQLPASAPGACGGSRRRAS